jgi:hypothetical protein
MPSQFFITGLPRSRTAWLANWLTTGETFCYHDGLSGCASLDAFDRKLAAHPICGDSDSGLAFFWEPLRKAYPDAQWAIVRRDPLFVAASLVRMTPYEGTANLTPTAAEEFVAEASARLDKLAAEPGVFSISVEQLATREGARALWWHCLRDRSPWNAPRWELLRDLRVTVASERVRVPLAAGAALLGRA